MKKCKLGDLLTIKQGYAFKSEKYLSNGYYVLCTLGNFGNDNNFKYDLGKAVYYPEGEFSDEFVLSENDLIMPLTEQVYGLFGNTAFIPKTSGFEFVLNQRVGKVIPDESKINKKYLHYLLATQFVRDQIEATASSTKQRNTSPEKIYNVNVYIPELADQIKIGHFLYSIESKINNKREIINNLQKIIDLIFEYWFCQFEFPDDVGHPYKSSGNEMVWNDEMKREIPKEWRVGCLNDIAEYINGLACQKYRPGYGEDSYPVIKIREMHEGITKDTERISKNIPSKNIIQKGSILFSWSATLEIDIWAGEKAGLNQHIFKVIPKGDYSDAYVYEQLKYYIVNFVKMAESRKTTMGHINQDHMKQSRIVIPEKCVIEKFNNSIQPLYEYMIQAKSQIIYLTNYMEWILPMLMNGQVQID